MGLPVNHAAENALATIGAVLWSVQIIPQLVLSYRTKSTKGLSENLMLIWYLATLFLGAYLVAQRLSIPLQIQPQLFGMFSAVSYAQCLYYERGFSRIKAGAVLFVLLAVFAGFEAGSVYALWAGQNNGHEWPLLMYGYISAVLLAVGLAPQYWEIYKLRQVIGISLFFLAVDILGGVFSFLSLFFRSDLDIAAFVSYAGVVVLDSLVILLAFILNPIAKRKGYWIGDKPSGGGGSGGSSAGETGETGETEGGSGHPAGAAASGTAMDVRPVRSRAGSSGVHMHAIMSRESAGRARQGGQPIMSADTQSTVVDGDAYMGTAKTARHSDEDGDRQIGMADEAVGRGMGAHAAGAEAVEALKPHG